MLCSTASLQKSQTRAELPALHLFVVGAQRPGLLVETRGSQVSCAHSFPSTAALSLYFDNSQGEKGTEKRPRDISESKKEDQGAGDLAFEQSCCPPPPPPCHMKTMLHGEKFPVYFPVEGARGPLTTAPSQSMPSILEDLLQGYRSNQLDSPWKYRHGTSTAQRVPRYFLYKMALISF